MTAALTVVLCETRNGDADRRALEHDLTEALAVFPNVRFATMPSLYDLGPDGPAMRLLQSLEGNLAVLGWLYPRAAYWILRANGVQGRMGHPPATPGEQSAPIDLPPADGAPLRTLWCLDLRGQGTHGILQQVEGMIRESVGQGATVRADDRDAASGGVTHVEETVQPRWYPVIDRDRCVNCMECLNFCLFGTFGLDEFGQIFVEQPDACRDGCPACSRICPSSAIIFPKYPDPAIAGDPEAHLADNGSNSIQVLPAHGVQNLAEFEREQALSADKASGRAGEGLATQEDTLDRLVDELDRTDL